LLEEDEGEVDGEGEGKMERRERMDVRACEVMGPVVEGDLMRERKGETIAERGGKAA
jgi:hypothetical protein